MLSLRGVGQSTRQVVDILKQAVEEKVELMHNEMLGDIMIHLDNVQVQLQRVVEQQRVIQSEQAAQNKKND